MGQQENVRQAGQQARHRTEQGGEKQRGAARERQRQRQRDRERDRETRRGTQRGLELRGARPPTSNSPWRGVVRTEDSIEIFRPSRPPGTVCPMSTRRPASADTSGNRPVPVWMVQKPGALSLGTILTSPFQMPCWFASVKVPTLTPPITGSFSAVQELLCGYPGFPNPAIGVLAEAATTRAARKETVSIMVWMV